MRSGPHQPDAAHDTPVLRHVPVLLALLVSMLAAASCARPAVVGAQREAAVTPADTAHGDHFVVVYRPGPAWRAGRPVGEQDLRAHFHFMKALFDAGRLTLAGPFLDDDGGMAVFRARDRADAERTVASDPAVTSGVMIGQVRAFRAAFDAARSDGAAGVRK